MRRRLMGYASILALLVLGACAAVDRVAPAGSASPLAPSLFGRSPAEEMVGYVASLRTMDEGALVAEAARQRQAAAGEATDLARVKAAIALSLAHPAEDGDILALVEPVAKRDNAGAELKAMASFLLVLTTERRRLRESATAAGSRLRDERRAHEAQKQRADALQERAAQLQQKLDALTELEKSLSDRPSPSR